MEKEQLDILEGKIDELSQKIQVVIDNQNSQYTDIILELRELKNKIEEKRSKTKPLDEKAIEDLYDNACKVVIKSGRVSTSYLQRTLDIGYSQAVQIIDMLEERKIISESKGAKPREVLVKL